MSKNVANHSDTRREDWGTPRELFGTLSKEHDFVIDLCANKHNALCDRYIDEHVDIFSSAAFGVVEEAKERAEVKTPYAWINPPYKRNGKTGLFVARAVEICNEVGLGLVALIPATVGSVWWRENVTPAFDFWISLGRVRFVGAPGTSQFDLALAVRAEPGNTWLGLTNAHASLGVAYARFA